MKASFDISIVQNRAVETCKYEKKSIQIMILREWDWLIVLRMVQFSSAYIRPHANHQQPLPYML